MIRRLTADLAHSESNVETPRPAKRKTSGRFPVKPSVGGSEHKNESLLASPILSKPPPLPLKPFPSVAEPVSSVASRPGVAPLITNSERNRSNSESQMPTSVREKRMGIIPRKNTESEKVEIRKNNRLSHLRGLSHGSALQKSSIPPVSDSSSPTSPVDGHFDKLAFSRRLSSLPEGKRKSRIEHSNIELARGVHYSLNQVYGPLKDLIKVLRGGTSKRTSIERTYYNAYSFKDELGKQLAHYESREDDNEEDDIRQATASIRESCNICIKTFQQLALALQKSVNPLVSQSNPRIVRTLMHLLYASLIEARNSCLKLRDVDLRSNTLDGARDFNRDTDYSLPKGRPSTSHRVRDHQGSVVNVTQANGSSTERATLLRSADRMAEAAGSSPPQRNHSSIENISVNDMPTPSLSRSSTFSGSIEDDESQQFERIWYKTNAASDTALVVLANCTSYLANARSYANSRSNDSEVNMYDMLLERCKRMRDIAEVLRRRLSTSSARSTSLRDNPDFWSSVTVFTRVCITSEYVFPCF